MLQGYPFFGTGAAAPTADNVTFLDPILESDVATLTIRGKSREQKIMGISFCSDTPALGSRLELRIGNQVTDVRVIDVFPALDGDLVSQPVNMVNYIDLGGISIMEDEKIDIRLYDPGAAEIMSGVLWVEDGEPTVSIPHGQMVTLRFGGSNDLGTSLGASGFDMDTRKLVNERLYTPFMCIVRPEDKVVEALIMRAGKDSMTFPPIGRMIYPHAPLQFTGREYNSGYVIGKGQAQAATKVEIILFLIESEGPVESSPSSPKVDPVKGVKIPGVTTIGDILGLGGSFSRKRGGKLRIARR